MINPLAAVLPITEDTVGVQLPCSGKGSDKAVGMFETEDVSASSGGAAKMYRNCTGSGRV